MQIKSVTVSTFLALATGGVLLFQVAIASPLDTRAQDPGVRPGAAGAGGPLAGLSANELEYFTAGQVDFPRRRMWRTASGRG